LQYFINYGLMLNIMVYYHFHLSIQDHNFLFITKKLLKFQLLSLLH